MSNEGEVQSLRARIDEVAASKRTVRCAHAEWPGCFRAVTLNPMRGPRAHREQRGAHPTTFRYPAAHDAANEGNRTTIGVEVRLIRC
jgi:hypothetical protein